MRYRLRCPLSFRRNSSEVPSGEKRGLLSSGPCVRAVSPPPAICLSQICRLPLRDELNAIVFPSGETAGLSSLPEYVNVSKRTGSTGGCRSSDPAERQPRDRASERHGSQHEPARRLRSRADRCRRRPIAVLILRRGHSGEIRDRAPTESAPPDSSRGIAGRRAPAPEGCRRLRARDPADPPAGSRSSFLRPMRPETRAGRSAFRGGWRPARTDRLADRWRASPRTCSGAIYPTVPSTVPACVSVGDIIVSPAGELAEPVISVLARPKSRIFRRPSGVTMMFSGLRSRCTTPRSCAAPRPLAICIAKSIALRMGIACVPAAEVSRCRSVSPSTSSMTMYGASLDDTQLEHRDQVGMIEGAGRSRLLLEPFQPVGIRGEGRRQRL